MSILTKENFMSLLEISLSSFKAKCYQNSRVYNGEKWKLQSVSKEQKPSIMDDEIDLRDLFWTIWRGRILIIASMIASVCIASLHLRSAARLYTVTYTFQPVADTSQELPANRLGGLASLAGITLPSASGRDFQTFKALLQSEEVAGQLMTKQEIIRKVFGGEWNKKLMHYEQPKLSITGHMTNWLKELLTGEGRQDYVPPNAARLSDWLHNSISLSTDKQNGSLVIKSETPDPQFVIQIMTALTTITDRIIKDRFLGNGKQSIKFYQNKIAAARSRESREALAQLIVKEQQKLMLASNQSFFVAKPLTTPNVSLRPTSPKSSRTLILGLLFGGFLGVAILLIHKAIKGD